MRSEPLFHMVYTSACGPRFSGEKLLEQLQQEWKRNQEKGVTGMLLFADKTFFEVLEGPKPVLDELFVKVSRDARQGNAMKLFEGPVTRRTFEDWTVGVPSEEEAVQPSNDFFQEGQCLQSLAPSPTRDLLEAFRAGSWRMTPSSRGEPLSMEADAGSSLVQKTRERLAQSELTE